MAPLVSSCADDDANQLTTLRQGLSIDCAGSEVDYGTLEFAFVRVDYLDRPETLEFAVRPANGPLALDCSGGDISDVELGPVNRLPVGDAVMSFRFMGNGPCDDGSGRLYEVLESQVLVCDLADSDSLPAPCPVTSTPVICVTF